MNIFYFILPAQPPPPHRHKFSKGPSLMWKHCSWLVVDSIISAANEVNCVIS